MPWSDKYKVLLIHIPKTGGTSIEDALGMKGNKSGYGIVNNKAIQHYKWEEYKKLTTPKFEGFTKISIVRNPYTRFISEYYWCQIKGIGFKSKQTINEFLSTVESIVKNKDFNKTRFHDHFIPQHKFIYNENEQKFVVDKLFYFEKMNEVRDFLYKYWKWLPHKLKNKDKNRINNLTKKQQSRIYQLYKKDFILFGYDKNIENNITENKDLYKIYSFKIFLSYIIYKIKRAFNIITKLFTLNFK